MSLTLRDCHLECGTTLQMPSQTQQNSIDVKIVLFIY